MPKLKHADTYKSAFEAAQDVALKKEAQEKLGTSDGKKIAVAAIRQAGGRPSPKDALEHLQARRPELFASEETETAVEEAPSPTNGVAAQA